MSEIETIEYRGHQIKVCLDDDPLNPRTDYDSLGNMVCFHKRYILGDEHELSSSDFDGWDEIEEYLRNECDAVVILPLGLYDHSGISMYVGASAGWDSGQVGFIYCTRAEILKWHMRKRLSARLLALVEQGLRSEVETYDQYLRGEVYGFMVEGPECDDSCWGFFGDKGYMIEEAKSNIDYSIRQIELPGFELQAN